MEEEEKKKIDAEIKKWHAYYYAAIMKIQEENDSLLEFLLNPQMSRREKRRWKKLQRQWELAQRKKAKRKK
jgi:hypothetical protein